MEGRAAAATGCSAATTLEHFLGQSTKQNATVTAIDKVPFCSRNERDTYTLEWDEGTIHHTETLERCGEPWRVGDQVQVWSTSGEPQTSGPTTLWVTFGFLAAVFASAIVWFARGRNRVRRSARAALDGTWQPHTFATVGRPGDPDFRVASAEPMRHRRRDWAFRIFSADVSAVTRSGVQGTLYIDAIKGDRPRGLSLHTTVDGERVWRWHH